MNLQKGKEDTSPHLHRQKNKKIRIPDFDKNLDSQSSPKQKENNKNRGTNSKSNKKKKNLQNKSRTICPIKEISSHFLNFKKKIEGGFGSHNLSERVSLLCSLLFCFVIWIGKIRKSKEDDKKTK